MRRDAVVRAIFLAFILVAQCFGVPEMVRHGYPNCVTCHFSPSGGGLLRDYGRVQASEILSAFKGREVQEDGPVSLGAQFRGLQLLEKTKRGTFSRPILMQADAEMALQKQVAGVRAFAVGTMGDFYGQTISRRHYAGIAYEGFSLRAGKFLPFFGLALPDHFLSIRDGIGLGLGDEATSIELGATYELGSSFVTWSGGSGYARQAFNWGANQAGFSVRTDGTLGPFLVASLTPRVYLMAEILRDPKELRGYARLSWEPIRGLVVYVARQHWKDSFSSAGIDFFPLQGVETRFEGALKPGGWTAWAMVNLYI